MKTTFRAKRDQSNAKNLFTIREPPPRRPAPEIDRQVLPNHQRRDRIQINLVHTPVHKKVSRDAKQHHRIHTNKEETVVEQIIEAAESRIEQAARGQHQKTPVQFWLGAPYDRQSRQRAECHHVEKRDTEESRVSLMQLQRIEAPH